jgi:hypothetical protein
MSIRDIVLGPGGSYIESKLNPPKKPVKKKAKEKKNSGLTPSEDALNAVAPEVSSSERSASGIPFGTDIKVGDTFKQPKYSIVDQYKVYGTLDNAGRANLLLQMGSIPGLYGKGEAPTREYIAKQGNAVTFRRQDYDALLKLMAHSDTVGTTSYTDSIITFYNNPGLAQQYFGQITPTTRAISLSNPGALELDLNNKFLDLFDEPADKKTAKAYSAEMIRAQQAAGGANRLDPVLSEQIFRKYVTKKANTLISTTLEDGDANTNPITEGAFGMTITKLRNVYRENYLPINEKKVYKDAIAASRSQQAFQNVLQNIQMKATQYFPAIAEGIRNGQSVSDLLDAPINSYAQVFGVKPNQVPQSFLTKIASGTSIPSQDDVLRTVYNSEGIEKTPGYRSQQLNDFKTMMKTFGIGPV